MSTNQGILAIGGRGRKSDERFSEILKLDCQDGKIENCKWKKIESKLDVARSSHVVIPLPESYVICKEGFHGDGTDTFDPDGFTEEANGKHYRMFDDKYVEWEEAHTHCDEMGARLPVLDSKETIDIIKKYLDESNFTVFEQWDRSSRRVWLGLIYDRGSGLYWADGQKIVSYPASSRLFVWEARRLVHLLNPPKTHHIILI